MQGIVPNLWFNDNAEEAVAFYTSIFKNSRAGNTVRYGKAGAEASGMPEGIVMTVAFQIAGHDFLALNGGPQFEFTPANSFSVACGTLEEVDELWKELSAGGQVLMELDKYDFSEMYGWCSDRYGVSWQVSLAGEPQKIIPSLLFVGDQFGKAEEAIGFYTSQLDNSGLDFLSRYPEGEPDAGKVNYASFRLLGQNFAAMESGLREHKFTFTPAVSYMVNCDTQEEIDRLWEGLSEGGEKSVCGWLTDKYGVSWQVIPAALEELMTDEDPEKAEKIAQALFKMEKIEIEGLKRAREAA